MDLQLAQLRSFVTVAEELHFGRAALRLGLSQPQVSRHIRGLEQTLGVVLFERTARNTHLSDAGAALLDDARETLAAAERLRARSEIVARGTGGRATVGFVWSTLSFLAPLVAAAGERLAEVELFTIQLRFVEIGPALRRGDVDLVIGRRLHEETEMIDLPLAAEPSVLAVSENHRFARQDAVALEQIDGEPMIALARGLAPRAYDALMSAVSSRGVHPRLVRHVRSATEALALVSTGIGVYRLPASAAQPYPGVTYRTLEGAPSRIMLMRRPEPQAPQVRAVAELACELFGDASDAYKHSPRALEVSLAEA